jgi:hypothetical protein
VQAQQASAVRRFADGVQRLFNIDLSQHYDTLLHEALLSPPAAEDAAPAPASTTQQQQQAGPSTIPKLPAFRLVLNHDCQ